LSSLSLSLYPPPEGRSFTERTGKEKKILMENINSENTNKNKVKKRL